MKLSMQFFLFLIFQPYSYFETQTHTLDFTYIANSVPRRNDLYENMTLYFYQKQRVVIEDELASQLSNIIIDVELLCGCNCKDTESSYCQHGTYECGLCKCDSGWSGKKL